MTAEELERMIERREMSRLELKESFGAECIETACAFANAAGGYVVIGVDDRGVPSKIVSERAGEISGGALKVALKVALKTALKDDNDEIVAKILAVYKEIANDTTISLSAVAEKVGLSPRTVDEYVGIMKSAKVLRRKGGRKFGEWEILTK